MNFSTAKRHLLFASLAAVTAFSVFATSATAQSGNRSSSRSYQPSTKQYRPSTQYRSTTQGSTSKARKQTITPQQRRQQFQQVAKNKGAELGLEGYCPVCVVSNRKWVIGDVNHSATYDGKTYFFPSNDIRQKFVDNPIKFAPALGGDCTVCFEKSGKRTDGNIRFASIHQNRLFLFPSSNERDMFNRSPKTYENVDLAADGNCIVCRAKMNETVKGSEEFTAIHNGLRYLFPADAPRQAFIQSPQQFVDAAAKSMMKDSMHASKDKMMKDKMQGDEMHTSADKMADKKMHDETMHKGDMKGEMKKTMQHDTTMMKDGAMKKEGTMKQQAQTSNRG